MSEYFLIGEIKSVYNNKGFVSVKIYSDFPDRVKILKKVLIDIFGDKRLFIIENIDIKSPFFIFKFRNFNSLEDCHILVGKKIFINERQLPKLKSNEYFIHDLVGSDVYLENKFFGKLLEVLQLPANDVYVVKSEDGKEILVPAVIQFIEKFNSVEKKLYLNSEFEFLEDDEN